MPYKKPTLTTGYVSKIRSVAKEPENLECRVRILKIKEISDAFDSFNNPTIHDLKRTLLKISSLSKGSEYSIFFDELPIQYFIFWRITLLFGELPPQ